MRNPWFLGLMGAFCWGVAPIFGKLGLRGIDPIDGLIARTLVTMSVILVWAFGAGRLGAVAAISPKAWLYLALEALLATLVGDLFYFLALKHGTAGVAAIALSVSPVVTVGLASLFLHEGYTILQTLGALLVASGILLVAMGG